MVGKICRRRPPFSSLWAPSADEAAGPCRIPSLHRLLLATGDAGPGFQSGHSRVGGRGRGNREGRSITRRVEEADGGRQADFSRLATGPRAACGRPPSSVLVAVGYRAVTGRRLLLK